MGHMKRIAQPAVVLGLLAVVGFWLGQGPVYGAVNTYIDDVRLTSLADLVVYDDLYVKFGTSAPFMTRYNSGSTRWELVDSAGNVMFYVVDAGTTGTTTFNGNLRGGAAAAWNLQANTGQSLVLNSADGTGRVTVASTGLVTVTNNLEPEADGTRALGGAAKQWSNVYSVLGTFSGDVSVGGGDITSSTTTTNVINATSTTVNAFGAATTLVVGAGTGTTTVGNNLKADSVIATTLVTATANDTSPSVSGTNTLVIPNTWTAANNITALDDGTAGQLLTIIGGDSDCVITDGSALKLAGNWTAAANATLRLIYDGANWYECGRSAN